MSPVTLGLGWVVFKRISYARHPEPALPVTYVRKRNFNPTTRHDQYGNETRHNLTVPTTEHTSAEQSARRQLTESIP